jgi:hypothetical protein
MTQRKDMHRLSPSVISVTLCFKKSIGHVRHVNQNDANHFAKFKIPCRRLEAIRGCENKQVSGWHR